MSLIFVHWASSKIITLYFCLEVTGLKEKVCFLLQVINVDSYTTYIISTNYRDIQEYAQDNRQRDFQLIF